MSDRVRDVVVVGGGPAGAAVACLLARRGRDVLLLDAARFPRDKVCGDSVAPGAWRLLIAGRLARRHDLADRLVGVAAGIVPPRAVLAPRFLWSLLTA